MSRTAQGARARARIEVTAAIKEEARRQLADEGAAKLSLRAVARELGMVSSALYRYFPSRDDLLTALIIDAYDSLGERAETAHAAVVAGAGAGTGADAAEPAAPAGPVERWVAVCEAVRGWALAHPHEYALIYGSPVPGYHAPESTVPAAARVGLLLIGIVRDAHQGPGLAELPLPAELRAEAERIAADLAPDLPPAAAAALVAAWAELYGLVGFELFGQFHRVVEDREPFFRHAVTRLALGVGLRPPQDDPR
ncbi:TetR/AcrR family transcriptional regulator [Streptomyces antibioticus]|uniref:TetR/AcrR family transcriptional regulator n=1 Tax=Streptomyces antibioticus TaxID=1890 RepID=UPI0004C7366F|nr:TetR/AcrR family transcriptional regulator [Streptomyces antibioticus]MCX4743664.1 TetR/AcrR family transcriptional regulator [Streptomyces antibioticus]MCX5167236.1 TetR/AcrR family transcriptional regulator [Streptomyces antibioticus]